MLYAPPIDVDKATARIMRAVAPVAFHNAPRAHRLTLHCAPSSGASVACVLRGYTRTNRRVLLERLAAIAVRARRPIMFEDYSGYIRYSPSRSLYLYPRD